MTRTFTGLCIASAFAFAASLGAQSPTSTTTPQSSSMNKSGHEVTVTGCLMKGGDGNYMLNNARVEPASSATTTAPGATTTAPTGSATGSSTATGTSGTTPPSSASSSASSSMPTMWMLQGGKDLDKHVGHKIQVTGVANWGGSSSPSSQPGSTASTTTPPTSNPYPTGSATGTTASGTTGTTGSTAGEQRSSSSAHESGTMMNHPRLDVQSVKMISSSCS